MRIFTLRNKIDDSKESSCLNGKLLVLKKDPDTSHVNFIDVIGKRIIWETTSLVSKEETDDGIVVTTSSGSVYDLIDVETLLPTYVSTVKVEEPPKPKIDFDILDEKHDYKPIHYGDGYDRFQYEFNREITREEFITFLEEKNHCTRTEQQHPYQDYAKIEGSGSKWTYIWVHCYTD